MKILVLTGGGCYCYGQSLILSKCNNIDKFEAFGGTSGGGINALCCATGNINKLTKFWENYAKQIFKFYPILQYQPWCPRYGETVINDALKNVFTSNRKFGTLDKKVFIGTHDLNRGKPKVFESHDVEDGDWNIWEIARMTSAAQTFFPPWKGYADGGIFFNDPIMYTITALHNDGIPFEEMEIFSIGTGLKYDNYNRGNPKTHLAWLGIILHDELEGSSVLKERAYAKQIIPIKNYTHIEFERLDNSMDDPELMNLLPNVWATEITKGIELINKF